jgi:hypothetical protein
MQQNTRGLPLILMKLHALLLLLITLSACRHNTAQDDVISTFTVPHILAPDSRDSLCLHNQTHLAIADNEYAGLFEFCDTILYLSGNQEIGYNYPRLNSIWEIGNINLGVFDVVPDYNTSVYPHADISYHTNVNQSFYPVYLINYAPQTKLLEMKDRSIYGVQEALDTNGNWRPIEGLGISFCGRGYQKVRVPTNMFATVLFKKYTGTYKTKIRVRIRNGEHIFLSESFEGYINEKQFYFNKDYELYRIFKNNEVFTMREHFFGAVPIETDDSWLKEIVPASYK